jgi:adenylyltransferase/sulfurtransferase
MYDKAAAGPISGRGFFFAVRHLRGGPSLEPIEVESLDVRELAAAGGDDWLLLDCRTPEEHATARIAGALLIPMQDLPVRVAEIEALRDKPVIVHCHHGVRSLRVTHWLRERGFPAVTSMQGGIDAWSTDVDPNVPKY